MPKPTFVPIPMTEVSKYCPDAGGDWLWDGYLAPGNVTLLTSQWKAGKTTLLTGLLRALEGGGSFLDRPLAAGRALVVSEESVKHWNDRLKRIPLGRHVELLSRPFGGGRPTV